MLLILLLLVAGFLLGGLGERRLANPDEGRYAEIAREMAASGDFVTPRLNGLNYFEMPPLQDWATAVSFKLFGENEFAARLYTALCALGSVMLMFFVGARLFDERTGLLAAAVLIAAPYFAAMAGVVTLDMGLTFWMTLAVAAFLVAQHAPHVADSRRWMWVSAAGMAGAVLSKGLIGVVFPAAVVFLYGVLHRDVSLLKRIPWVSGLVVFFALVSPWFIWVSIENPEFARFFFIHEHVERFTTTTHRRVAPAWYFLPILLAGLLPWALVLFPAALCAWSRPGHIVASDGAYTSTTFKPLRFVLIFTAFIFAFFSASGSKLPAYILPFFPVLALVIAVYLRDVPAKRLAWLTGPMLAAALAGAYAISRALVTREAVAFSGPLHGQMGQWLYIATAVLAVGAAAGFVLLLKSQKWVGIATIASATVIAVGLIQIGYEKISPLQSGYAVAQVIKAKSTPATRLYSIKIWDQSAAFYLGRTLTLVEYVDEFALGQQQEPAKSMASLKDFSTAWSAPGAVIAIIAPGDGEALRALGLQFEIIHQDPRRVAIRKL